MENLNKEAVMAYAPKAITKLWTNERGQQREMALAFVTARCYVVGEKTEYRKDDEAYKVYRVVYTWSQDGQTDIKPIIEDGKVVNSFPTKAVFKDSRECQAFVEKQNEKLLRRKTKDLFDDERNAVKRVFNENVEKCKAYAMIMMSEEERSYFLGEDSLSEEK